MNDDDSRRAAARVAWPAVLKYPGSAELVIVDDYEEWTLDPDVYGRQYAPNDVLIDSAGTEYRIECDGAAPRGRARPEPTGKIVVPSEFLKLAEQHLAASGVPIEWLSAHVRDVPEGSRIITAIRYIARNSGDDSADEAEDEA